MAKSTPPPKPPSESPEDKVRNGFQETWEGTKEFFDDLSDLKKGQDKEGTIIGIKNNMRMRGANAWLLMCSIMIASLGLDLNSPAVIIGAMLISPLMSPILGIGLAVGINDRNTLTISLQNLGVSIAIALVTSTFYFFFTPIGEMTHEIVSRTAPTLLDAFVAFFGGIAGIISGTRKDKSNAIPGVAIATALMPPLCVTGFGLANLIRYGSTKESFTSITNLNNWEVTLNSFYLFFINAVLVALATYLIVRLLRFPMKAYIDEGDRKRNLRLVATFGFIILLPSVFILRGVLREIETDNQIKTALQASFGTAQKYVDDWKKIRTEDGYDLLVKVYGPTISQNIPIYKQQLEEALPDFNNIEIIPSTEVDLDKFKAVEAQFSEVERLDSIINQMITQPRTEQNLRIALLEKKITSLQSDSLLQRNIETGILALFDDYVAEVSYFNYPVDTVAKKYPVLNIKWKDEKPNPEIEERLVRYIKTMTRKGTVRVAYLQ